MLINDVVLSTVLLTALTIAPEDWHSIVPLKTTRAEVETILGPGEPGYLSIYKLREGKLSIEYSSGPCRADRKGGWDVAENVVVSMLFSPKEKRTLAELKLHRRKLRKVVDRHVIGIVYYVNDEQGIWYEIQDGKVENIEYFPAKKYDNLKCPK